MSKRAKPDEATKFNVWLSPEDRQRLRELRALLAGEVSEPSDSDIVRHAIRELHAARTAQRGQSKGEVQ